MTRHYTITGLLITALWLGLAALYAWSRWADFMMLKPSELGDFLAGVLSPLAFLWLVLGYFQQGQELKLSTEALRLQAEELRNSVDQQRDLVEATREQVEFEKEQNERLRHERALAASPRFQILCNGSAPSHGPSTDWRRFFIAISNTGAPVTGVRVHATGWGRIDKQIAMLQIMDRGSVHKLELEMPIQTMLEPIELTFFYVDSLGQDGNLKLFSAANPTGALNFARIEG